MSDEIENNVPNPSAEGVLNEPQTEPKLSYEDLQAELRKVRSEAAGRRVALREMEDKAKRWEEYEESQKSELQKLQEALAKKEQLLSDYELEKTKRSIAKEFGLEEDDVDLLTGSDEDTNRKIAERLKAKNEKIKSSTPSRPADLLAGNRGTPIGSTNPNSFDDLLRSMVRNR